MLLVLFIGIAAQAQSSTVENKDVKVETVAMGAITITQAERVTLEKSTEVARLYKFKNSRIGSTANLMENKTPFEQSTFQNLLYAMRLSQTIQSEWHRAMRNALRTVLLMYGKLPIVILH